MFKVINEDTRTTSNIFFVYFEHIFAHCSVVSIVNFKQVTGCWVPASPSQEPVPQFREGPVNVNSSVAIKKLFQFRFK